MLWLNALGVLKNPRLLIAGGLIIASGFAGYQVAAWKYGEKIAEHKLEHLQAVHAAKVQADKINALRLEHTNDIATIHALQNQEREVVERVVTKQVIKYVETDNAQQCGLSADGVRIHDTAARGSLPDDTESSAVVDGGAIEVTNAEVIPVITENYATCNAIRERYVLLQDWVRGLDGRASSND